jgi:hypothetical protein
VSVFLSPQELHGEERIMPAMIAYLAAHNAPVSSGTGFAFATFAACRIAIV